MPILDIAILQIKVAQCLAQLLLLIEQQITARLQLSSSCSRSRFRDLHVTSINLHQQETTLNDGF